MKLIGIADGTTDIPNRKLELLVDEAVLDERRKNFAMPQKKVESPFLRRYAQLVTSASTGGVYRKF